MKKINLILIILFLSFKAHAGTHVVDNGTLLLTLDDSDASFSVADSRNSTTWSQNVLTGKTVSNVVTTSSSISYTINDSNDTGLTDIDIVISLDGDEINVEISDNDISMSSDLDYPFPFTTPSSNYFAVLPMNEGFYIPADEIEASDQVIDLFQGWEASLPMFGYTNGDKGYMVIVETPFDAMIRTIEVSNLMQSYIVWDEQKGNFGYTRKLKYYFYDTGKDYVEMTNDVREWMRINGYVKTLKNKVNDNPDVDSVIGALKLWASAAGANNYDDWSDYLVTQDVTEAIISVDNNSGVSVGYDSATATNVRGNLHLTSWYAIYQDTWDPEEYPANSTRGYPDAVIRQSDQSFQPGWNGGYENSRKAIYEFDAVSYPNLMRGMVASHVLDDVLDDIFVDTTGSNSLREDYDADHLQNRREDAQYRQWILQYHQENNFVVGTEQGAWWLIPYCDYFEGIWTITKWDTDGVYNSNYTTYQIGYKYRIPLFQLVFHDSIVSFCRWDNPLEEFGSDNNYLDWNRKELFWILYGMMPISRPTANEWATYRERIADSTKRCKEVVDIVGKLKMTNHEFLNASHSQQKTEWSDGTVITVDFDAQTYTVTNIYTTLRNVTVSNVTITGI